MKTGTQISKKKCCIVNNSGAYRWLGTGALRDPKGFLWTLRRKAQQLGAGEGKPRCTHGRNEPEGLRTRDRS